MMPRALGVMLDSMTPWAGRHAIEHDALAQSSHYLACRVGPGRHAKMGHFMIFVL